MYPLLAQRTGISSHLLYRKVLSSQLSVQSNGFQADVGQEEDLEAVKTQALALGALKAVLDRRVDEFVTRFVCPSLAFGGIYQGRYLLGTSLCRPCISEGIVRVAREEGARFIAHGATGKGNDQIRFELSVAAIAPELQFVAPWRLSAFYDRFGGRRDLMDYARVSLL